MNSAMIWAVSTFNRTIVELKLFLLYCIAQQNQTFNRTIVELKFEIVDIAGAKTQLLTEP